MRFTGLSVGSLDLQSRQVCCMSVEGVMNYHKVNDSEPMKMPIEPEDNSDTEACFSEEEQEVEDNDEFD